jgi:hypothetical protein
MNKNIFVVTAFGSKDSQGNDSPEKIHADKMQNEVFRKLGDGWTSGYSIAQGELGKVTKPVYERIRDAYVIVADTAYDGSNLLYEIAIAQALGKPVFAISSESGGNNKFDFAPLQRILYDKKVFDSDAFSNETDDLRKKLKKVLEVPEVSSQEELFKKQPYSILMGTTTKDGVNTSMADKVAELENMAANLIKEPKENRGNIRVQRIVGVDDVFRAMNKDLKTAKKTVRATRFSDATIMDAIGAPGEFYNTIRKMPDEFYKTSEETKRSDGFKRIIATNNPAKLEEIKDLVKHNKEHRFTIYLSDEHAHTFELLIIDQKIVFVNFRQGSGSNANYNGYRFNNTTVAVDFARFFDALTPQDADSKVSCIDIKSDEDYEKEMAKIEKRFNEGLKRYQEKS